MRKDDTSENFENKCSEDDIIITPIGRPIEEENSQIDESSYNLEELNSFDNNTHSKFYEDKKTNLHPSFNNINKKYYKKPSSYSYKESSSSLKNTQKNEEYKEGYIHSNNVKYNKIGTNGNMKSVGSSLSNVDKTYSSEKFFLEKSFITKTVMLSISLFFVGVLAVLGYRINTVNRQVMQIQSREGFETENSEILDIISQKEDLVEQVVSLQTEVQMIRRHVEVLDENVFGNDDIILEDDALETYQPDILPNEEDILHEESLGSLDSLESSLEEEFLTDYDLDSDFLHIHVVEGGDTLSSISRQFYGSVAYFNLIKDANNLTSDDLYLGQVLFIPEIVSE